MVTIHDNVINRLARAAAGFVKAVQANERGWSGSREKFEEQLHRNEMEAWQALCEAVAELEAYGG